MKKVSFMWLNKKTGNARIEFHRLGDVKNINGRPAVLMEIKEFED